MADLLDIAYRLMSKENQKEINEIVKYVQDKIEKNRVPGMLALGLLCRDFEKMAKEVKPDVLANKI
jgi:hypothetical protein